jgi:hypothetical protein
MKKQIVLGLLALTSATSAFASGSPVVYCNIPGNSDRTIYVGLTERDNNTDTSYMTDVSSVDVQDSKGKLDNSLAPADKNANLGSYFSKSVKDGTNTKVVAERLKIRLKSVEGSVIAVDASGNGGKDGMEATLTVVLRGKDANGADLKDLRGVKTTCAYTYE